MHKTKHKNYKNYPDVLQKKGGNLFFFVTIMDEVKKLREWIILI